jgi:hypothetical protein
VVLFTDWVFWGQLVSHKKDEIIKVDEIHIGVHDTVLTLKNTIANMWKISLDNMVVLLHETDNEIVDLDDDFLCLEDLAIQKISKVRHEVCMHENRNQSNLTKCPVFQLVVHRKCGAEISPQLQSIRPERCKLYYVRNRSLWQPFEGFIVRRTHSGYGFCTLRRKPSSAAKFGCAKLRQ